MKKGISKGLGVITGDGLSDEQLLNYRIFISSTSAIFAAFTFLSVIYCIFEYKISKFSSNWTRKLQIRFLEDAIASGALKISPPGGISELSKIHPSLLVLDKIDEREREEEKGIRGRTAQVSKRTKRTRFSRKFESKKSSKINAVYQKGQVPQENISSISPIDDQETIRDSYKHFKALIVNSRRFKMFESMLKEETPKKIGFGSYIVYVVAVNHYITSVIFVESKSYDNITLLMLIYLRLVFSLGFTMWGRIGNVFC